MNCCKKTRGHLLSEKEVIDEKGFKAYLDDMELSKQNTIKSLEDGVVDGEDIKSIVFDIVSKRKMFDYGLSRRFMLYFGFLAPLIRCCSKEHYEEFTRVKKNFEKAVERLENECDIIDVFDRIRKADNFLRNFLTLQQKIMLKFDSHNVIQAKGSESEDSAGEREEIIGHDDLISKNLNSPNGLVTAFTIVKLLKMLMPLTEDNKQLGAFELSLFKSFYGASAEKEEVEKLMRGSLIQKKKKEAQPDVLLDPQE